MGNVLASEVMRVSKEITMTGPDNGSLSVHTEAVPIALRWDIEDPKVMAAIEEHYGKLLVSLLMDRFREELKPPLEGDLVTLTLGDDLAIAAVPGEFFVELGLDLKRRSAVPNTFLFGYLNRGFAYFPTINAAWQGGYGGKEATFVEVGAGEKFINRALANIYYQTGRLSRIPRF